MVTPPTLRHVRRAPTYRSFSEKEGPMASVTAPPVSATARARAGQIPAPVAFYLLVSISVFFLAGSSAPTPLYAVYHAAWGFSPLTTTIVFGVYALAVLAALLTVGSLSDYVGRRPVLLVAIDLQRHGDHHEKAQPNRHAPITPWTGPHDTILR